MSLHQQGIRAALLGVVANLVLAVIKVAAGVLGHSHALIADGVESLADVASSLVVIGGLHISSRPADDNHPFGHGKAEPLAGGLVALMLAAAAGWIAWSSLAEIREPHQSPAPFTLLVLALVVIVKAALSRRVLRVGEQLDSVSVRGDAWHHGSDALTSAAAFVGISIALIGGPGYEEADDWAAFVASLVIGSNAVRLLRASVDDLMDSSVPPGFVDQVRKLASGVDGVVAIEKCRVRKSGLEICMDIHVVVDGGLTVRRGHEIGHAVKDRLVTAGRRIVDVTVHIEPDEMDTPGRSAAPGAAMPPASPTDRDRDRGD